MLESATLTAEHMELCEIADLLVAQLRANTPDLSALASIRGRMTKVLLLHLAQEDQLFYPRMKRSSNPQVRELATRFENEMGTLADTHRSYATRWPGVAIEKDWNGFRTETQAVVAALRRRIRREEGELYPRLHAA